MPPNKKLPHIVVRDIGAAEPFTPRSGGGSSSGPTPPADRESHARALLVQLDGVVKAAESASARDDLPAAENGVYVTITGRSGEPLAFQSLERPSERIELLGTFHRHGCQEATVFIPVAASNCFPKLVEAYRTKDRADTGKPVNRLLVEGIGAFRLAVLRDLWSDDPQLFPQPGVMFRWETWLRTNTLNRFRAEAERAGLPLGPAPLHFPETDVVLVHATPEQMADLAATRCAWPASGARQ
jgi:hypothetical protein